MQVTLQQIYTWSATDILLYLYYKNARTSATELKQTWARFFATEKLQLSWEELAPDRVQYKTSYDQDKVQQNWNRFKQDTYTYLN